MKSTPTNIMLFNTNLYFSYACEENNKTKLYIAANSLTVERSYFEVEVVDTGQLGAIGKILNFINEVKDPCFCRFVV